MVVIAAVARALTKTVANNFRELTPSLGSRVMANAMPKEHEAARIAAASYPSA